jgi:hypothetical protein
MKLTNNILRTFENTLHWKTWPAHDRYADRQNRPPDERDADSAEEGAANESVDAQQPERELVSSSGARSKSAQSKA